MNKKAVSPWIAYVLLIGFVVALGAFVYSWVSGYAGDATVDIKERTYNSELCESLGVSVTACINSSTSQDLYINVTNRGDLRETKLIFNFLKMSGNSVSEIYSIEVNTSLKPQYSKIFDAEDINLTWTPDTSTLVEVVPGTEKDDFEIICSERAGEASFENC